MHFAMPWRFLFVSLSFFLFVVDDGTVNGRPKNKNKKHENETSHLQSIESTQDTIIAPVSGKSANICYERNM